MAATLTFADRSTLAAAIAIFDRMLDADEPATPIPVVPLPTQGRPMAWGAKVSQTFRDRVRWIVTDLSIGPNIDEGCDLLMTCMAWESGRSFSPSKRNLAGSGATGLIQFMPKTAVGLGTTTDALAKMTPEAQLNFVWKYFAPFDEQLRTLSDLYMAILWPAAVGQADTEALWTRTGRPTTYRQNSGLDANSDGTITKGEAAGKVLALLAEGRRPENMA